MNYRQACLNGHLVPWMVAMVLFFVLSASLWAQQREAKAPRENEGASPEPLSTRQSRLADRFDHLELLAGRLAELSRATQPRRARLLRELVAKSRENDIAGRFEVIVADLQGEHLGKATSGQLALQGELQKLLDLLLQEDRGRQIDSERKRVQKYLTELKRLIQLQRGIKARTEGGDEQKEITDDQQRLARSTEQLKQQIEANEGSSSDENKNREEAASGEAGQPDGADLEQRGSRETESKDQSPSDGPGDKPSPGEPKSGENKESGDPSGNEKSSEPSQSGQPGSQGNPSGDSPEQSGGSSPPSADQAEPSQESQNPAERAQQRLQRAKQRMEQALEELEKAKRDQAVDRQEKALRELEQAKVELERILRQLREEEMERMLALLEARFRKMLDMQVEVYEQTKKLESSQDSVAEHEIEIACGRLDRQERHIVREADRALLLLREDGTTVAFPEAIEQARGDMQSVAKRLGAVKIGLITQGLEEDIITALEESLAALQQALKKAREQRSQQQQAQQGSPGEQQLVDQLAELRMIRALQNRINRRTERYGEILGNQPAVDPDLLEALEELAVRQERVFQATRDLDSGRNQ